MFSHCWRTCGRLFFSLPLSPPQLFPGVVAVVDVFAKGDTPATESFLSAILFRRVEAR